MTWLRGLAATTAFRWTLAIAGGFTAMALLLFGFLYWQTAVHERERVDAVVEQAAHAIVATAPDRVLEALTAWIQADPHDVRYAGLFTADGTHLGGNLLALPRGIEVDGRVHHAVFRGIDRDREGDDPEVVRATAWRLPGGELVVVGYDIDELEDVDRIILRALGLGLLPAVLLALGVGAQQAAPGPPPLAAQPRATARSDRS